MAGQMQKTAADSIDIYNFLYLPYVCFKFVRQEAVGIYYIPWPAKKIAAQISYQGCLPKTSQFCAACTANWPKLPKNELQKNIWYYVAGAQNDIMNL
jgi:hypothetical protein